MSKYCKPMGLYVTYLDCMDCEDKECMQSHRKENKMKQEEVIKTSNCKYGRVLFGRDCKACPNYEKCGLTKGIKVAKKRFKAQVEKGQTVFLAFCSKRQGDKANIIFKTTVERIEEKEDSLLYKCKVERCVNDKTISEKEYNRFYSFKNANIDTGHKGSYYPVFTTKERCIKWING